VGIAGETSAEMARKMKLVLERSRDVARYRKLKKRATIDTTHHELIQRLRNYLIEEEGLELSELQVERLGVVVANRVAGYTKKEDFKAQLQLALEENGVGMDEFTTHEVTRYLEKLIAQGVHGPIGERGLEGGE
jgi:hypothetical protein